MGISFKENEAMYCKIWFHIMTEINVLLPADREDRKIKIIRNYFFQLVIVVAKHWKIIFDFFWVCAFIKNQSQSNSFP